MATKTKPTNKSEPHWQVLLTFPVVGLGYYDYNPTLLKRGQVVGLMHEPSNAHDRNAVKVMYQNRKLGYVPRKLTTVLHRAKRQGCKFYSFVNQHFPNAGKLDEILFIRVKVLIEPLDDEDREEAWEEDFWRSMILP